MPLRRQRGERQCGIARGRAYRLAPSKTMLRPTHNWTGWMYWPTTITMKMAGKRWTTSPSAPATAANNLRVAQQISVTSNVTTRRRASPSKQRRKECRHVVHTPSRTSHHAAEEMGVQQEDVWFLLIEQLRADTQQDVAVQNGEQPSGSASHGRTRSRRLDMVPCIRPTRIRSQPARTTVPVSPVVLREEETGSEAGSTWS